MFLNCHNLRELYITNCKTNNLKEATNMFSGCENLEKKDILIKKFCGSNANCICF